MKTNALSHVSTAKAAIRDLFEAHGRTGALTLIAEVLKETLPQRRGRPTREEAMNRAILRALGDIIPEVNLAEDKVQELAEIRE